MNEHHRISLRLREYDYGQAGAYFVTLCTRERECLLGAITGDAMQLNDAGRMVQTVWDELPTHYAGVQTDSFVVMPNHVHGIIILVGVGPCACPDEIRVGPNETENHTGQPRGVAPTMATLTLPDVVHRYKSLTTTRYRHGVKNYGWPPFHGKLWQRNYYEHIARSETELNQIREYIANNPRQWEMDDEFIEGRC